MAGKDLEAVREARITVEQVQHQQNLSSVCFDYADAGPDPVDFQ